MKKCQNTSPCAQCISPIPIVNVFNWNIWPFSLYTSSTGSSAHQEGVCCQIPGSSCSNWSEETGEWFLLKDTKLMRRNMKKCWELQTIASLWHLFSTVHVGHLRISEEEEERELYHLLSRIVSQDSLFLRETHQFFDLLSVTNFFCNWCEWLLGARLLAA